MANIAISEADGAEYVASLMVRCNLSDAELESIPGPALLKLLKAERELIGEFEHVKEDGDPSEPGHPDNPRSSYDV